MTQYNGSDGRFRRLIESVTDHAIYLLNLDGFVASWNLGAQRVTGYTPDEAIGQHISRFFTDEDKLAGIPTRALELARQEHRCEIEGWRRRKDGSRFWVTSVIEPVLEDNGTVSGFVEVMRDITERHYAQQALLESESRFRLLVQGVVDYSMFMLDPNGIVVNWNAGAERIKGYYADEIIGQHFSRFYTQADRDAGLPFRALSIAAEQGRFEGEGVRVRKDGSPFWASVVIDAIWDEAGNLKGFAKITRDISERMAQQQALQDSERQFRLLVSSVTDYALFMLDPNGIVVSWNAGAEKIKGYKPAEIIGQHFSVFYTEKERTEGMPLRALHAARTDGRFEAEAWRRRKDGSLFWANVVIDAIHDETGRLIGFAKVTRDVTERRTTQEALQRAQEQMAHAQKMEALGELTGGVAHDFNNLLMIVSGQAELLKRHAAGNEKALRSADAITTAARRGEALTRRLLAFSRRQQLRPEPVDLAALTQSLKEMLSGSLGKHIELTTLVSDDIWAVQADLSELELALVNLCINARDAMPEGGRLMILTENQRLRAGMQIPDLDGEFVGISVSDTGVGIPDDILPRICDPFFTTKPIGQGTGLGLSQAYGFAHQSGGGITIDSDLGKGTRITLFLPRAAATAAAVSRQPEAADRVVRMAAPRVLVVEDNPDVGSVTIGLLEELGHQVVIVQSAAEALHILSRDSAFDLLFSDVVMAGMDGIALGRAVREAHPTIPVLLTTGYNKNRDAAASEFPLISKPFGLPELSRAIADALANRRGTLVRLEEARRHRSASAGR